eukprot:7415944-Pyramimonas_sp.AAC.1
MSQEDETQHRSQLGRSAVTRVRVSREKFIFLTPAKTPCRVSLISLAGLRATCISSQRGPGSLVVNASNWRQRSTATAHEVLPCDWTGGIAVLVAQAPPLFAFPAGQAESAKARQTQGHVLAKRPKKVADVFEDIFDCLSGRGAGEQLERLFQDATIKRASEFPVGEHLAETRAAGAVAGQRAALPASLSCRMRRACPGCDPCLRTRL